MRGDPRDTRSEGPAKQAASRQERLARALRANLKRRKGQRRARDEAEGAGKDVRGDDENRR